MPLLGKLDCTHIYHRYPIVISISDPIVAIKIRRKVRSRARLPLEAKLSSG